MANKVGKLIKEARTEAGFTQEELARKVTGLTASDLIKAERGEKELTQAVLKEIAKKTGVTQISLIEAAKSSTYTEKKTAKATAAKKTATAKKKTAKSSSSKDDDDDFTTSEKKLVQLYRKADKDTKSKVLSLLKGDDDAEAGDLLSSILNGAMDLLGKK